MKKHINEYSEEWINKTIFCGIFFCTEQNAYVIIPLQNRRIIMPTEATNFIDEGDKSYKEIYKWLLLNGYIITAGILMDAIGESKLFSL